MKNWLPWVLILGGAAIAAIVYWGSTEVSKKSDAEILQEAIMSQRAAEEAARQSAEELSQKLLPAPASCAGLVTSVVFAVCDTEPYPEEDWPDWTLIASADEQACLVDAFHQTNAHAYEVRGETYDEEAPTGNRMGWFISAVCGASLFTDGVDYGAADASLSDLIAGFHAERAESIFKVRQSF